MPSRAPRLNSSRTDRSRARLYRDPDRWVGDSLRQEARRKREQRALTQARKELEAEAAQHGGPITFLAKQQLAIRATSGPIPDARTLQEYGSIDPSYPERIMGWAEEETAHRREIERMVVSAQVGESKGIIAIQQRAQIFGLILGVLSIGGGIVLGIWGTHPWAGAAISLAGLAALVWPHKQAK